MDTRAPTGYPACMKKGGANLSAPPDRMKQNFFILLFIVWLFLYHFPREGHAVLNFLTCLLYPSGRFTKASGFFLECPFTACLAVECIFFAEERYSVCAGSCDNLVHHFIVRVVRSLEDNFARAILKGV